MIIFGIKALLNPYTYKQHSVFHIDGYERTQCCFTQEVMAEMAKWKKRKNYEDGGAIRKDRPGKTKESIQNSQPYYSLDLRRQLGEKYA